MNSSDRPCRRDVLRTLVAGAMATAAAPFTLIAAAAPRAGCPPRLKPGDVVGLINPAGATYEEVDLQIVEETLGALGLRCRRGVHILDRYGYLAGKDEDRAADVNGMFADDAVQAVLTVRGGWGCSRILPLLNYDTIRKRPKILCGYSDITALLVAVYARTGLVTFHGPVGTSTWNEFSTSLFRRILFDGEKVTMVNPTTKGDALVPTKDRVETLVGGTALGILVGGNLSVLTGMIGSDYLPPWDNVILFVEDEGEHVGRVDRMLTQLKLAGVLGKIRGFIFGKCTNCGPAEGYGSLTLHDVLVDHIAPLRIPSWYGAMIGHIENKFTLPIGIEAEIDADRGSIALLEPAVV